MNVKEAVKNFLSEKDVEIENFVSCSMGIAATIDDILKEKNISKEDFAQSLEVTPSEVKKWLSGTFNFDLRLIGKIENVLQEKILFTKYDIETQH